MSRSGERRPDLAGGGEQFGGLAADDGEIFVLVGRGVLRRAELHHLAFGDDGGGGRQDVERVQTADLDHHLEGLAEQEIADQHARLVAPQHAGGELAAAHVALVDHVVVQQRRGVHEFDRGGELDVAVAGIAGELGHRDRQHRPQPLAAGGDQMVARPPESSSLREPVRARIAAFTRSMSAATRSTSRSSDVGARVFEWDDDGHQQLSTEARGEHRNRCAWATRPRATCAQGRSQLCMLCS